MSWSKDQIFTLIQSIPIHHKKLDNLEGMIAQLEQIR